MEIKVIISPKKYKFAEDLGELGDNEMEDEDEFEEEADEGSEMSSDEEEEGKVESESDGEVDMNDELAVIRLDSRRTPIRKCEGHCF